MSQSVRDVIADAMSKEDPVVFEMLTQGELRETADAILAALAAAGMAVVKIEPSEEMLKAAVWVKYGSMAAWTGDNDGYRAAIWSAMLKASPQ